MANEYVQKLSELIARIHPTVPRGKAIEVKPFFGGAAGYLDGHIFISTNQGRPGAETPRRRSAKAF